MPRARNLAKLACSLAVLLSSPTFPHAQAGRAAVLRHERTPRTASAGDPAPSTLERAFVPLNVWLLDNLDPDYGSPSPADTLAVMSGTGGPLWNMEGLGLCEAVGAWRAISVAPTGEYALVAEFCRSPVERLSKFDSFGNLLWHTDIEAVAAVDIADTGFAYAIGGDTQFGPAILRIDPADGSIVQSAPYGGYYGGVDLVVDDAHDSVWIVGGDIQKLSGDLGLEFVIYPVTYIAVSVDYTSDGAAWIAERNSGGLTGKLLKVSPEGAVLHSIPLTRSPGSLAIDRAEDSVWVAMMWPSGGLEKYDRDGNLLLRADTETLAYSVQVDDESGSVWAAFRDGTVMHFSASGEPLLVVAGAAGSQYRGAWLALGPATESDEGQDGGSGGHSSRSLPDRER